MELFLPNLEDKDSTTKKTSSISPAAIVDLESTSADDGDNREPEIFTSAPSSPLDKVRSSSFGDTNMMYQAGKFYMQQVKDLFAKQRETDKKSSSMFNKLYQTTAAAVLPVPSMSVTTMNPIPDTTNPEDLETVLPPTFRTIHYQPQLSSPGLSPPPTRTTRQSSTTTNSATRLPLPTSSRVSRIPVAVVKKRRFIFSPNAWEGESVQESPLTPQQDVEEGTTAQNQRELANVSTTGIAAIGKTYLTLPSLVLSLLSFPVLHSQLLLPIKPPFNSNVISYKHASQCSFSIRLHIFFHHLHIFSRQRYFSSSRKSRYASYTPPRAKYRNGLCAK